MEHGWFFLLATRQRSVKRKRKKKTQRVFTSETIDRTKKRNDIYASSWIKRPLYAFRGIRSTFAYIRANIGVGREDNAKKGKKREERKRITRPLCEEKVVKKKKKRKRR